jgi:endonuclease G
VETYEATKATQQANASERVAERTPERVRKIDAIRSGNIEQADSPERVAARIDRLSHYYPDVRPVDPAALAAGDEDAQHAAGKILERIIGTEDFVEVRYLEAGDRAARAVGRVDIRDDRGRLAGYGTGSLISSHLIMTNHHVLPDAGTARTSAVEFNYQDGVDGRPLQAILLDLDPDTFFAADEELDFAVCAVKGDTTPFGSNPLIEMEGKAVAGDFVTIVQHPRGEKKHVALRDNRIVDVLDNGFLHYEADTEPGSSGSPVFNDEWELVALHHASVKTDDATPGKDYVNEGIRVSRIVKKLREQPLTPVQKALLEELFPPEGLVLPGIAQPASGNGQPTAPVAVRSTSAAAPVGGSGGGAVTVPLEVTVRVADGGATTASVAQEAVRIDPDYSNRRGYDPDFLGGDAHSVPLPTLSDAMAAAAAVNSRATAEPRYVLPYHHFSVVQSRERRLAFVTAVNIDGITSRRVKRERDRWSFDPRIPKDEQTGTEVYEGNDLDLGHLVRRLDPAWGDTNDVAKLANDDTFHLTNCTPQHKDFNRNKTSWAGLEDYVLEHADNLNFRVNVFTGPVLADDDQEFQGVKLPRQFWKVVTMVKQDNGGGVLSATAYLLSQEKLIKGFEEADLEAFSYGEYRTYQVPVSRIEQLTGLSFGRLTDFDPLAQDEHEAIRATAVEVERLDDVVL